MYFFEAIRLGSMLRPQAFDMLFDGIGTCAMGAAAEGAGLVQYKTGVVALMGAYPPVGFEEKWPIVDELQAMDCPACGRSSHGRTGTIPHLNDHHGWTRERIAAWAEPIELAAAEREKTEAVRSVEETTELVTT